MKNINTLLMLRKFIILAFLAFGAYINAQSQGYGYEYTYDNAGNRIKRMYIILKSSPVNEEPNVIDTSAIIDKSITQEYILHPNPTRGIIQIEIPGTVDIVKQISIYSMNGTLLDKEQHSGSSVTIDLSNNPAGMYIVVCLMNNQRKQWKIIKE